MSVPSHNHVTSSHMRSPYGTSDKFASIRPTTSSEFSSGYRPRMSTASDFPNHPMARTADPFSTRSIDFPSLRGHSTSENFGGDDYEYGYNRDFDPSGTSSLFDVDSFAPHPSMRTASMFDRDIMMRAKTASAFDDDLFARRPRMMASAFDDDFLLHQPRRVASAFDDDIFSSSKRSSSRTASIFDDDALFSRRSRPTASAIPDPVFPRSTSKMFAGEYFE